MGKISAPVFDAPEYKIAIAKDKRPVDLVHLARQTGGDKALEEEVLQLFVRQANMLAHDLTGDTSTEARKRLAHTLKGTARAVGAFPVAQMAAEIEEDPSAKGGVLRLKNQVDATCDYIASLLR